MKTKFTLILFFLIIFSGCSSHILGDGVTEADLIEPIEGRVDGWLFKTTVMQTSAPNPLSGLLFPGVESEAKYLQFKNRDGHIQAIDPFVIQTDDPNDPNDDLVTQTERVLFDLSGSDTDSSRADSNNGGVLLRFTHVDSTEILPFLHGSTLSECFELESSRSIDEAHNFDKNDLHWTFVNEVVYQIMGGGICDDFVSNIVDVDTVTVRFRASFYRPKATEYQPLVVEEKSEVNEKFGVFQNLKVSRNEDSKNLQAKIFANRFDPMRQEPLIFYFHEGFPPKFKNGFQSIKTQTNQILEDVGAKLRIDFKDHDFDDIERNFGDFRYNFVVWHESIDTTSGILGYGPASVFSETGEFISANLHVYNRGFEQYRQLIETFLQHQGASSKPDPNKPWDEIACEPGTRVEATDANAHLQSPLFARIRAVLEIPEVEGEEQNPRGSFLPSYAGEEAGFLQEYHRVLPSLRFSLPQWNRFVSSRKQSPSELNEWMEGHRRSENLFASLLRNESPFTNAPGFNSNWVEEQSAFATELKEISKNHIQFRQYEDWLRGSHNIYSFNELDAIESLNRSARLCKENSFWESDDEYRDRLIEGVFFHVVIHEFGHNLGLRHNFYGSVDEPHFRGDEISASVMDYAPVEVEFARELRWGAYDEAALKWIYGNARTKEVMLEEDFLYCTDEHRFYSPLCTAHDLGTTPTEIVLNHIEKYDSLYSLRNFRGDRQFWNTQNYAAMAYDATLPLLRFWYLSEFSWNEQTDQVQSLLESLDAHVGGENVRAEGVYDALAVDFDRESDAALRLVMGFFHALVITPSEDREYQTVFDSFYGDVSQIGIALDKVYALYGFTQLHLVNDYDPNIETFAAMFDRLDPDLEGLSERILDDFLLGDFEIFDWWKDLPLSLFSSAVHTPSVRNLSLRDRASFDYFSSIEEMRFAFGDDAMEEMLLEENVQQVFSVDGENYSHTYFEDIGLHLVAGEINQPLSWQVIRDYNQARSEGQQSSLVTEQLRRLLLFDRYFEQRI